MGMPQYYEGAAKRFMVGRRTLTNADPIALSADHLCRRVLIVAEAGDSVVLVPQGQPAAVGFPIPQIQADGSFIPLELWVNNVAAVWVAGANTDVVYYYYEEI